MVGGGGRAEGGVQLKSGSVGSFGGYLTFYLPLLKHIVPIWKRDQKCTEYIFLSSFSQFYYLVFLHLVYYSCFQTAEPVFVNLLRSPKTDSKPDWPVRNPICRTGPRGYICWRNDSLKSIPGLLKRLQIRTQPRSQDDEPVPTRFLVLSPHRLFYNSSQIPICSCLINGTNRRSFCV